ncbi:hypothetical protein PUN28_011161 [Cardiocondyla obscurior]|uniref:Uncharacterized protein n=1 Tax=Cardiocondyla obscurior TaxID=286306 RepID=A0AAW2FM32_9HYME
MVKNFSVKLILLLDTLRRTQISRVFKDFKQSAMDKVRELELKITENKLNSEKLMNEINKYKIVINVTNFYF